MLVLLLATADFGDVTVAALTKFSKDGGNMIVALDVDLSGPVLELVEGLGLRLHGDGSQVFDHFREDNVVGAYPIRSTSMVGQLGSNSDMVLVSFKGVGLRINENDPAWVSVLSAANTAYAADALTATASRLDAAADKTVLVASAQTNSNARISVYGSIHMLTNAAWGQTMEGSLLSNEELVTQLTAWTCLEQGVLRVASVSHKRADGNLPDRMLHEQHKKDEPLSFFSDPEVGPATSVYTAGEEVRYSIALEQYDRIGWQPYDANDVQLELVLLEPQVRVTLNSSTRGTFSGVVKTPTKFGVYKLRVMYRRVGLSTVLSEQLISLRPPEAEEHKRFQLTSLPFYAAVVALMLASTAFLARAS